MAARLYEMTEPYVIEPNSSSTAQTSPWIDMADCDEAVAYIQAGRANARVVAKFRQAKTDAGGNVKDVSGKTVTIAATTAAGKLGMLAIREHEMDFRNGFRYLQLHTDGVSVANSSLVFTVPRSLPTPRSNVDAAKV